MWGPPVIDVEKKFDAGDGRAAAWIPLALPGDFRPYRQWVAWFVQAVISN